MESRAAGDRNDPLGVVELFFADKLGLSAADAIDAAAQLDEHLSTWGLGLIPTAHVKELEEAVRRNASSA